MKLKVQSIHFDADQKLLDFIDEKVEKLLHFYEDIIDGEVFLKLDKALNERNKITEIKLNAPGKILFVKEQCSTFEEATDMAVNSMKKQLTKHKEKIKGI